MTVHGPAGSSTFERVWHLPILPEHVEELRGKLCDLSSTGAVNETRRNDAPAAETRLPLLAPRSRLTAAVSLIPRRLPLRRRKHGRKACR